MADRAARRARRAHITQALQGSPARRLDAARKAIATALADGRISPASAARWAARARRENVSALLAALTPVAGQAAANRPVLAHSNQQVLSILTAMLSGGGPDPEGDIECDPSLATLWPPGVWDDGGSGHGAYSPQPSVYEDGQLVQSGHAENGAPAYRPYASAPGRRGEITDAEAAALFPPASWPPSESWVQARAAMEARRQPYTDEELHLALFGDTTGREAG